MTDPLELKLTENSIEYVARAVLQLLTGVVPERAAQISLLMDLNETNFRLANDNAGFNVSAGAFGLVQFTQRSMHALWLFGYAGLLSMRANAAPIIASQWTDTLLDLAQIDAAELRNPDASEIRSLLEKIDQLIATESLESFDWPHGIPLPEDGRPVDPERAAVFDLTCMATAYVLLHEVKHVMFSSVEARPDDIDEEYACDQYAQSFMTDRIAEYAAASGYPAGKVLMKRFMGIAMAAAFILFATPRDLWLGGRSHPPVSGRWRRAANAAELEADDPFWLYFAALAISILEYRGAQIAARKVPTYKELCLSLIEDVEALEI